MSSKYNSSICPTCRDSVSPTAKKMAETQTCNKCGHKFSAVYSRIFACQGCRQAILSCPMLRCPHCGYEFLVGDMSDINLVLSRYYRQTGISPSR